MKNMENNDFITIKINKLVEWNEPNGEGCLVSDKITKEGYKIYLTADNSKQEIREMFLEIDPIQNRLNRQETVKKTFLT